MITLLYCGFGCLQVYHVILLVIGLTAEVSIWHETHNMLIGHVVVSTYYMKYLGNNILYDIQ